MPVPPYAQPSETTRFDQVPLAPGCANWVRIGALSARPVEAVDLGPQELTALGVELPEHPGIPGADQPDLVDAAASAHCWKEAFAALLAGHSSTARRSAGQLWPFRSRSSHQRSTSPPTRSVDPPGAVHAAPWARTAHSSRLRAGRRKGAGEWGAIGWLGGRAGWVIATWFSGVVAQHGTFADDPGV